MQKNKLFSTSVLLATLAGMAVVYSPQASAGPAASAAFDWTSLSATDTAGNGFTFLGSASSIFSTTTYAYAGGGGAVQQDSSSDWSSALSTIVGPVTSTASATTLSTSISAPYSGSTTADPTTGTVDRQQDFTLAAGDSVTFTLGYTGFLSSSNPSNALQLSLSALDDTFTVSNGAPNVFVTQSASGSDASYSGTLKLIFTNDTASTVTGSFDANAQVTAAAVPEPSTYVLMLAGLFGVFAAFSRRQQRG